jgi:hypothetical protein
MFSTLVLAATTLRESVHLVVSLVTGAAFAGACIVSGGQVVAALKALRGLKPIKTVRKNRSKSIRRNRKTCEQKELIRWLLPPLEREKR